jgi:hypothetical protein
MADAVSDDERGLSDVLGYVIVFSLVVTAVLLVTAGGLSAVEDARDTERAQNAERAFEVLADNFAAIHERSAPSRSTEIDLGDAEIFYDSETLITIRGDDQELASQTVLPVRMNVEGDRAVVYEAGAVFRHTGGGISMVRPPPFLLSENRVHLPLIHTTAATVESAGGTTVLLRGVSEQRRIAAAGDRSSLGYDELTIQISSPRFEAWEGYLSEEEGLDCTTEADIETVTCTLDLGSSYSAYILVHQIELSLIL